MFEDLFYRKKLNENKLTHYGLVPKDDCWIYH